MTNSTTHADQDVDTSNHVVGEDARGANEAGEYSSIRPRSMHLELQINESFLRLVGFMRARLTDAATGGAAHDVSFGREEKRQFDQLEVKKSRRKPTRLFVRTLQLGQRRMIARTDELDIVVKFFYRKLKRIVFQLCNNEEFMRIDILWSNIQALHVCFDDNRFDTLRIQVKSSSELYRAKRRLAGRYREWQQRGDYIPRTFYLQFEKGTLERSYGKMLYTDPSSNLLRLSPPGKEEEEEAQATSAQQVLTQQTRMFTAVPPFVQAATPSTAMIRSTNTGTDLLAHEHGGIQLYDLHNTIPRAYEIQHSQRNIAYSDLTPLPQLQGSRHPRHEFLLIP